MSVIDIHPETASHAPHVEDGGDQARESNHRIANNLALVSALLRMQANGIAKKAEPLDAHTASAKLVEAAARVESVARLHRLLSSGAADSASAGPYLADICTGISGSLAIRDEIHFSDRSGDAKLAPERLNALGLFLTEALTNAFKHAHPSGVAGLINVTFSRNGHNLELESHDDGVGLPENFDPNRDGGLGFRILRSLAGQVGGILTFPPKEIGLCIRLDVPVAAVVRTR